MIQKKENQNYSILTDTETTEFLKQAYHTYQKQALDFYYAHKEKHHSDATLTRLLPLLTRTIILCQRYNLDAYDYLLEVLSSHTLQNAQETVKKLRRYADEIKEALIPLEKIGIARRKIYGIQFPSIFENTDRIYLKTSPILSEMELMQDIITYLNHPLPKQEHFSFKSEEIHNTDNQNQQKRFWLIQKQPMKPVKKLSDWADQCQKIITQLETNPKLLRSFFEFVAYSKTSNNITLEFNKFKKEHNISSAHLDKVIFLHLKAYQSETEDHLLFALKMIEKKLSTFRKELEQMLVKSTKKQSEQAIDMIVLSIKPSDISIMSTFSDWESCMSSGGLYFQDIMMQIGAGSIIAYGINSQNPEKKLARVLLKPYETAKTQKQRSLYQPDEDVEFNLPENLNNPSLFMDYADIQERKSKFIHDHTYHLDEDDLILDPHNVERIYKIDKIYGLQNPSLTKILQEFSITHLNNPSVYGLVMVADTMYLDNLNEVYQIYDKADKDNLIKFLTTNKISYQYDAENVIHTSHLNIAGYPAIHLRRLNVDSLTLDGYMLDKEIKSIRTKKLCIEYADTFKSKTFPKNLYIQNYILFQNSDKPFDMPFGITCNELNASYTGITNVAPDLSCLILNVSDTHITSIPALKLLSLNISKCKKIKTLPENLLVKDKLDISFSGITSLPPISTGYISAIGASELKSLHPNIKFNIFKGQKSGLKNIPKNLKAESFCASNSFITSIPKGTHIDEVDLKNTPLKIIHPNIKIKRLSIAQTPIKTLPKGLSFEKLDASKCENLSHLPSDLSVSWAINLSESKIKSIPPLKCENINLTKCEYIKELPQGIEFRTLFAANSSLKSLPDNITASIISCQDSKLKLIPNGLTATSFNAKGTKIKKIGTNVTIDNLIISETPIKYIPNSLRCKNIEAVNCQHLTEFPEYLTNLEKLNLSHSAVSKLRHTNVKTLNISYCESLQKIDSTVIFSNLIANNSGLKELPDNIYAKDINIIECPITQLPKNLKADKIYAMRSGIDEIPIDIECNQLFLDGTCITKIPPNIKVKSLSLKNSIVFTLNYSEHFTEIILNGPVKFISPEIPNHIIKGISEIEINLAKSRFIRAAKKNKKNAKLKEQQYIKS